MRRLKCVLSTVVLLCILGTGCSSQSTTNISEPVLRSFPLRVKVENTVVECTNATLTLPVVYIDEKQSPSPASKAGMALAFWNIFWPVLQNGSQAAYEALSVQGIECSAADSDGDIGLAEMRAGSTKVPDASVKGLLLFDSLALSFYETTGANGEPTHTVGTPMFFESNAFKHLPRFYKSSPFGLLRNAFSGRDNLLSADAQLPVATSDLAIELPFIECSESDMENGSLSLVGTAPESNDLAREIANFFRETQELLYPIDPVNTSHSIALKEYLSRHSSESALGHMNGFHADLPAEEFEDFVKWQRYKPVSKFVFDLGNLYLVLYSTEGNPDSSLRFGWVQRHEGTLRIVNYQTQTDLERFLKLPYVSGILNAKVQVRTN